LQEMHDGKGTARCAAELISGSLDQKQVKAPSMTKSEPVVKLAASLAR